MPRSVTVVLRCSTVDRKTLHIDLEYILSNPWPAKPMERDIILERPPAMRALNHLRQDGRVRWGVGTSGFRALSFLQYIPTSWYTTAGDYNILVVLEHDEAQRVDDCQGGIAICVYLHRKLVPRHSFPSFRATDELIGSR